MNDLYKNMENLYEFIFDEIPEEILANDEDNEIEHIFISCMQLITHSCKATCYEHLANFVEYKKKGEIKDDQ